MSGHNSLAGEITLDELERLIRILGMLGSHADGEVLNAARLAQRWVTEKGTDWRTLLTPAPELGVTGVVAREDPARLKAEHQHALAQAAQENYRKGYKAGLDAASSQWAAQVKAQAAYVRAASQPPPQAPQSPPQPSQSPTGHAGPQAPLGGYPAGSWQAVAQELLDRSVAGIPGVFRGSREEGFVTDVLARGFPKLTGPQETWLRDIAQRSGLSW